LPHSESASAPSTTGRAAPYAESWCQPAKVWPSAFFTRHRHAPAADVGTDQVLEDIEDVRVLGDLEHPRAEEVGLRFHLLDVGNARLQRLEPLAVAARALRAHRADG